MKAKKQIEKQEKNYDKYIQKNKDKIANKEKIDN
jgi:hypothetical protein